MLNFVKMSCQKKKRFAYKDLILSEHFVWQLYVIAVRYWWFCQLSSFLKRKAYVRISDQYVINWETSSLIYYEYIIRVSNISGSGFRGKVNVHYIYFLLNKFRFAVLHQIFQLFFYIKFFELFALFALH